MRKELILLADEELLAEKSVKALHEISLIIKKRVSNLDKSLYGSPASLENWMEESEKCETLAEFLCMYRNAYARIQRVIQRKQKSQVLQWLEEEDEVCTEYKTFSLPKSVWSAVVFEFR